jgi:hypothetical protein
MMATRQLNGFKKLQAMTFGPADRDPLSIYFREEESSGVSTLYIKTAPGD